MNRPKIHKSLLAVTLLPISVMALMMSIYFIFVEAPRTEENIREQLKNTVSNILISSKYPVSTGNVDIIKPLLESLTAKPYINKISIKNINDEYLISHTNISSDHSSILSIFYNAENNVSFINKDINLNSYNIYNYTEEIFEKQLIGFLEVEVNNHYIFKEKYASASYGLYITLGIYIFSLSGALRFSKKITDGIEDIDATLKNIGEGKLDSRTNPKLVDKFGNISNGIAKMANSIQQSEFKLNEKIDTATAKLHAYNKEIIENNKQLENSRLIADKANEAKSNFLSNISHEIRTPVNGIIGFTELLLSSNIDNEHKQYIQNIDDASNQLLRLINDLLDFSKIENDNIKVAITKTDIYDLVAKLHEFYSINSSRKKIEIYLEIAPETPRYIYTDKQKLEQIITNLLSNAIKFTPKGFVKVKLSSKQQDNRTCDLSISISDTGIGIDKSKHASIFNKFEQADMATSQEYGGSGLGLNIANLLAKKINGEISLDSEPEKGSNFTFSMKTQYENTNSTLDKRNINIAYFDEDNIHKENLSQLLITFGYNIKNDLNKTNNQEYKVGYKIYGFKSEIQAQEFIDSFEAINCNTKKIAFLSFSDHNLINSFYKKGFIHVSLRTYRPSLLCSLFVTKPNSNKRHTFFNSTDASALIIDDNIINIILLEKYLQKLGVNTHSTSCGQHALKILKETSPDIILTDLHMPNLSGFDFAQKVKQLSSMHKQTPIIAITADGSMKSQTKALESGIKQVLLKPISLKIIQQTLNKYIKINTYESDRDSNMESSNIEEILVKELPIFKDEIIASQSSNNITQLYQTIHRLVGGLEYCVGQENLLSQAKICYTAIQNEKSDISRISPPLNKLIDKINIEINKLAQ